MFKVGDRVYISGDTSELWIHDYNCRVVTEGTVEVTPKKYDKKIYVTLDSIDGEGDVGIYVRKSKVRLVSN